MVPPWAEEHDGLSQGNPGQLAVVWNSRQSFGLWVCNALWVKTESQMQWSGQPSEQAGSTCCSQGMTKEGERGLRAFC